MPDQQEDNIPYRQAYLCHSHAQLWRIPRIPKPDAWTHHNQVNTSLCKNNRSKNYGGDGENWYLVYVKMKLGNGEYIIKINFSCILQLIECIQNPLQ